MSTTRLRRLTERLCRIRPGAPFPDFALALVGGTAAGETVKRLRKKHLAGRPAILLLFPDHIRAVEQADLCVLCRSARSAGANFAAVARGDPFLAGKPALCLPFPVALDPTGALFRRLSLARGARGLYALDAEGRVAGFVVASRIEADFVAAALRWVGNA